MKEHILTFASHASNDATLRYAGGRAGANQSWATSSKVPQIALTFWIIKIAATTLGETGGDALSMTLKLGYAVSTLIFMVFFVAAVTAQIKAKSFHPFLYWT